MSIKVIIGAVVMVVIIGAGAYMLSKPSASAPEFTSSTTGAANSQTPVTEVPTASSATASKSLKTLRDVVEAGKDVECIFSTESANTKSNGTVFVSGANVRGDYSYWVPNADAIEQGHTIRKDSYVYVWTSRTSKGLKSEIPTTGKMYYPEGIGYDVPLGYSCKNWKVNSSKFALPTNIMFEPGAPRN